MSCTCVKEPELSLRILGEKNINWNLKISAYCGFCKEKYFFIKLCSILNEWFRERIKKSLS